MYMTNLMWLRMEHHWQRGVLVSQTVGEVISESTASLGEKISIRRFERYAGCTPSRLLSRRHAHLTQPALLHVSAPLAG
jgi:translation elongation factor EF-Ts